MSLGFNDNKPNVYVLCIQLNCFHSAIDNIKRNVTSPSEYDK